MAMILLGACAFEGPTTTSKGPPPSNANGTHRELQNLELTASVQPTRRPGPVQLPVKIRAENHSEKPVRLREEDLQLVAADGTMHSVRGRPMRAYGAGWSTSSDRASSSTRS